MKLFTGVYTALVTPFYKGKIDFESLDKIIAQQVAAGVAGLVVNGTTAESPTLTKDESLEILKHVKEKTKGKVKIVFGSGTNSTQSTIALSQAAEAVGVDGLLVVVPYYNKPTQEGIYQHFKAVAEAATIPVILYNVPSRTGSNMQPSTVIRLANDFKNIVAIKEAAGDMAQAMQLLKNKPKDFLVISGDDMIALPMVLAGASGVISVIGQGFPKEFSEMIRLGLNRKVDEAFKLHYNLSDCIDMIFEQGNPAGIKQVFQSLDIAGNTVRLPLVSVDESLAMRIDKFVETFNKLA